MKGPIFANPGNMAEKQQYGLTKKVRDLFKKGCKPPPR